MIFISPKFKNKSYFENRSVPFYCTPQKASSLPGTELQFGPVKEHVRVNETVTVRGKQAEKVRACSYLLFDVNL